jgi:hypothetical protein
MLCCVDPARVSTPTPKETERKREEKRKKRVKPNT